MTTDHNCDTPTDHPVGGEWTCPQCGRVWTVDKQGIWPKNDGVVA